jgi:hypothetical protein
MLPGDTLQGADKVVDRNLPSCGRYSALTTVALLGNIRVIDGIDFFPHGGTQRHTSASYALPCHTTFCQSAPLLLSVARQQNLQTTGGKVQPLLPYRQHLPLASWSIITI